MQIAAVVNGAASRKLEGIGALYSVFGNKIDIRTTECAGDGLRLAQEAVSSGAEVVVACGGDGTVQEVVRGIAGTSAALGVLPLGTANDYAVCLHIPTNLETAARVVAEGHRRALDLLKTNGQWIVTGMGCGLVADSALGCKRYLPYLGRFGLLGQRAIYLLSGLEHLLFRPLPDIPMRLYVDTEPLELRAMLLAVNNQAKVGGLFSFTPEAELDDGYLHLCVIERTVSRWDHPQYLLSALRGTIEEEHGVHLRRARRIEIECKESIICTGDGEQIGDEDLWVIEVVPRCLQVIVPKP